MIGDARYAQQGQPAGAPPRMPAVRGRHAARPHGHLRRGIGIYDRSEVE
jgi:hypothetical protein